MPTVAPTAHHPGGTMRTRHTVRSAVALTAVTLGLGAVSTGPALAEPPVHEHTHVVADLVVPAPEEGPDATFCGLVGVPMHLDLVENYREGVRGGFTYSADEMHGSYSWTNPETGLTFTQVNSGQGQDQKITDNGDGTITLVFSISGTQKVYGPDGTLLFHDSGVATIPLLIATNGTADPSDDEFLSAGEPTFHGPHPTSDRSFCDDFLTYTSG